MAGGQFNQAILIGFIGKEPKEYRTQGADTGIVRFSMATSERYKKRNGDMVEETQWHNVVSFNPYVNGFILSNLFKGDRVMVCGQVKYRSYENKEKQKVNVTEIVVPKFGGAVELLHSKDYQKTAAASQPQTESHQEKADFDDDIPF